MSILDTIAQHTHRRVALQKQQMPLAQLERLPDPVRQPRQLEKALKKQDIAFICEVKKASPSKGLLAADFPYCAIARDYEAAGADAISVLTEPEFFMGSDSYLQEIRAITQLPLLRKDFIVDPYQIVQSKKLGADAILLICALLTAHQLEQYQRMAHQLGLSVLVEVHDERELAMALQAEAAIIGVNNRDLHTFEVDTGNSVRLRQLAPEDIIFVSESGISSGQDIALLRSNRIDGVLIGETLMRSPDKAAALAQLKKGESC